MDDSVTKDQDVAPALLAVHVGARKVVYNFLQIVVTHLKMDLEV